VGIFRKRLAIGEMIQRNIGVQEDFIL